MPRRRRYADEREREEIALEPAVARAETEEEPEREDDLREARSPEELATRLQRSAGNQAVARALIQRFPVPGAPAPSAELPDVGTPAPGAAREAEKRTDPQAVLQAAVDAAKAKARTTNSVSADELKAAARRRMGEPVPGKLKDPRRLLDRLCDAVASAWAEWQAQAMMIGVVVNAAIATGGTIVARPIGALVENHAGGGASPEESEAVETVAAQFGTAFDTWASSTVVPGMPLFPAFAAFAGPVAPPMPSPPMPFRTLVSQVSLLEGLAGRMASSDPATQQVVQAVGYGISSVFPQWLDRTTYSLLGTGPIPSFAPPMMSVGPVVGGTAVGLPGFLKTA